MVLGVSVGCSLLLLCPLRGGMPERGLAGRHDWSLGKSPCIQPASEAYVRVVVDIEMGKVEGDGCVRMRWELESSMKKCTSVTGTADIRVLAFYRLWFSASRKDSNEEPCAARR